jgi:hypothetical protein
MDIINMNLTLVGEGKCPLTYLCPTHFLIHLPAFTQLIP